MAERKFIIEVEAAKAAEDGKPSMGPVYRSVFAKDGFPPPIPGLESCWDIFRYYIFYICFSLFIKSCFLHICLRGMIRMIIMHICLR